MASKTYGFIVEGNGELGGTFLLVKGGNKASAIECLKAQCLEDGDSDITEFTAYPLTKSEYYNQLAN